MADAKTNYLANKLLDHVLKHIAYTSPTTVYLALFSVIPTDSTGGTELTGASYARQALTFASASGSASTTSADANFTGLPASTVVAVGILDALTTGNLLYYKAIGPFSLNLNDQLTFPSGNIIVTEA